MSDPREEKLNELERVIASYQEKLDAVTTNYQVNISKITRFKKHFGHSQNLSQIEIRLYRTWAIITRF